MAYGDLLAVGNRTGVIHSYDGSWTPLTDTPRPQSANTVVHGIVVNHKNDDIVITRHYNPSLSVAQRQFCSWNGSSWTLGNANLGNRYSDADSTAYCSSIRCVSFSGIWGQRSEPVLSCEIVMIGLRFAILEVTGGTSIPLLHVYRCNCRVVHQQRCFCSWGNIAQGSPCYRGSGWTVHIDKLPAKKAKEILGLAVKEDGTTYISSVKSDCIFVFNPGAVNWKNLGVGPET